MPRGRESASVLLRRSARMSEPPAQTVLPVLTYHSIDDLSSPISTTPERFQGQMDRLAQTGWTGVTLDVALAGLSAGQWPARSFLLTFDDGYRNILEHAAPVIARYRIPAIVFLITTRVGTTTRWPGQPGWVPDAPLLDWQQLRELAAAGWTLGAHTQTHPRLPAISPADAEREIVTSKKEIEDRCGVRVETFAYPYGATSPAIEHVVGRHYRAAFGTRLSLVNARSRITELERIDAYYLRRLSIDRLDHALARAYLFGRRVARRIDGITRGLR